MVVGLTGGIGTGKSTVAGILGSSGVPVIDADQVAREVVEPGQPALAEIVAAFGPSVLDSDGRLDRPHMRARITQDAEARKTLEAITHPAIAKRIASRLQELATRASAVVVEAALMVETGSYRQYPVLLVVTCAPETQLARVQSRDGMSAQSARALIAAQLPMAEKEAVATHVIRNDGTLDDLRERTLEVWRQVIADQG